MLAILFRAVASFSPLIKIFKKVSFQTVSFSTPISCLRQILLKPLKTFTESNPENSVRSLWQIDFLIT